VKLEEFFANAPIVHGERMKIYIAGPYVKGDVAVNVREAIAAGEYVARLGHFPYIPHLTHFWHLLHPHNEVDFWYKQDNVWLELCDALLRIGGESIGADLEVSRMIQLGRPIYYSVFDIPKV
jgi:hypothetical protein